MRELTTKQREILDFILESIAEQGHFPSYREICVRFQLTSVATVAQHLNAIAEKGYLRREGRKLLPARGVRRDLGIPIVGQVAAGLPIEAIENVEGHLNWGEFGPEGSFAVRVVGDSMIDEGILEDDYVIVQRTQNVKSGDLVVAYVGENYEATVKRYHRHKDRIELKPANRRYQPIRLRLGEEEFQLAGKVVGVIRKV